MITSLSIDHGQPGDPVMINGNNFGSGPGEIHFVSGTGLDLTPPAGAIWTDGQIFTSVPVKTGVTDFNGQVYVKRTTDQKMSNLAAFRFEAIRDVRQITATSDRILKQPFHSVYSPPNQVWHGRSPNNVLFGNKDNDELMINTRLKNGWQVDSAQVVCQNNRQNSCDGGAYVWDFKPGSDWPYLNVRWWLNPDMPFYFARTVYHFAVRIVGPKDVPDGVVVP